MVKVSKVAAALIDINDAIFQGLCDKFLTLKYEYKNINSKGSVAGKDKTKKGTPDTIFIDKNNNYIFAEYTTKKKIENFKSFYKKIEQDIISCFTIEKAKIGNEKVSKIICCHTERLDLFEIEQLSKLCKSYNNDCVFEQLGIDDLSIQLEDYPSILDDYLNIKVGTGQIMQLIEYINFYDKPSLKVATPLSNQFFGREKEFDDGLLKLANTDLLLITGASGVGKTKFAIELCKKFVTLNPSYSILCFANKGVEAYEDLQAHLIANRDYIILIDDANRAMSNYKFLLYYLRADRVGKIKIIATVRDYAKDSIEDRSKEYHYRVLPIGLMSNEGITVILKSNDFNIQNERYIEKILSLARGNLRIAVMCAIIAKKSNSLSSLDDISQVYDYYFGDIYKKIVSSDKENSLKVLGIISFFRVISKERQNLNDRIFKTFSIDQNLFWTKCNELNQNEIVDLYENEIVKVSDQILSTYLSYKVFFQENILNFALLIRDFIDDESKFYDTINPILVSFDYRNITEILSEIFEQNWDLITRDNTFDYVLKTGQIFWFCVGNRLLTYFLNHINQLPYTENKEFSVDYEQNEMSFSSRSDMLSILSNYKRFYDDRAKSALELMFLFIEKRPDQSKKLSYLLKEKWMINRHDDDFELYSQHLLVDFLIERIGENKVENLYKVFFFKVASDLLETTFREDESSGGQIKIYTIYISLTESVKQLRVKIWNFLWSHYSNEKNNFTQY